MIPVEELRVRQCLARLLCASLSTHDENLELDDIERLENLTALAVDRTNTIHELVVRSLSVRNAPVVQILARALNRLGQRRACETICLRLNMSKIYTDPTELADHLRRVLAGAEACAIGSQMQRELKSLDPVVPVDAEDEKGVGA